MHSRKTVLTLSKLSSGLRRLLGRPRSAPSATSGQLSSRTVAALLLVAATGLAGCSSTGLEDSLQPIGNSKKQAAQSAKPNVKKLDPPGNGRYGDRKPVDFGKYHPDRYPVHGIDVSKWQGDIDWNEVRRAGVAFAFIKATEGGDHNDSRFQRNTGAAPAPPASRTRPITSTISAARRANRQPGSSPMCRGNRCRCPRFSMSSGTTRPRPVPTGPTRKLSASR
jgi:hypothetical protein